MDTNVVLVDQGDGVLSITLNRPEKRNALTGEMYSRMSAALVAADSDSDTQVVVFLGNGEGFCAGNDIADFLQLGLDESSPVLQFLHTLARFSKPLIAGVHGAAVGIGTTLLLHCDLIVASGNTRFALPFVKLGLCAENASSLLLPLQVGYHRAAEWLLLGDDFGAEEALQAGLINRIVAGEPAGVALELAHKLARLPATAVATTRRLLRASLRQPVLNTIQDEVKEFATLLQSPEAKAAFRHFLQQAK